jgi:iron complex outermembrane receptor protein
LDGSFPPDGRFETEDYVTVATLSNRYDWGEGYLRVYSENGDIDWVDQQGTPGLDTLTDYKYYGVRACQIFRPWEGGEFLTGVDLDYVEGEVTFRDPAAGDSFFPEETFRMISPYVAISQRIGFEKGVYVAPTAGFRYINHNQFDDEFGPQAGIVLGYRGTEVHTSYARGINYPGIFTKVQNDVFLPGENQWEGLNAEILDHYEVGISHTFEKKARIDLTFFYDDGRDRIVVSPPPPFPPLLTNIGKFSTRGVEGTVSVSPIEQLALFGGLTYMDPDPHDLPYAPQWTGSFGVNYRFFRGWQISLDGLYVDEHFVTSRARQRGTVNTDKVDAYFLLNSKLTYDFAIPSSRVTCQAYIAGENLTDTDYEQKKGYPMPGISMMGGVVVHF